MTSEMERGHGDGIRKWLREWVDRTSQRRVAKALGVNRDPLRRALNGTGDVTGVVREAVERYAREHGIQIHGIDTGASSSIGKTEVGSNEDGSGGEGEQAEDGETEQASRGSEEGTPDRTQHSKGGTQGYAGEQPPGEAAQGAQPDTSAQPGVGRSAAQTEGATGRDGVSSKQPSSLLGKIDGAATPSELAVLAGAPVLGELPVEAARAGALALARGWRWIRDPAPAGLHGDALYYLHTREDVNFADEGAKRVAFAPDTEIFECSLTGAELRYGVHPHQRQKSYAVERHEDRGLLIGIRMAALVPEKPYPDEQWFFGSEVCDADGARQATAAEVISERRRLLAMESSFAECSPEGNLTPWQLALRNTRMRVELQMVNGRYGLTIGEHVKGDRTWTPSTRLGIETRWREEEIELNAAEIRRQLRRRRRMAGMLWLPRLSGRIVRAAVRW